MMIGEMRGRGVAAVPALGALQPRPLVVVNRSPVVTSHGAVRSASAAVSPQLAQLAQLEGSDLLFLAPLAQLPPLYAQVEIRPLLRRIASCWPGAGRLP